MDLETFIDQVSEASWFCALRERRKSILVLCILSAAIIIRLCTLPQPRQVGRSFYTVDDGKTFFVDRIQVPPYRKGMSEAVGAMVFSCDGGATKFVGYLVRFTPEGKAQMEAAQAGNARPAEWPAGQETR